MDAFEQMYAHNNPNYGVNNPFFFLIILLFVEDKIILTIVATVSERHAPLSHTNTQLTQRRRYIHSYEVVRVLHIYISLIMICL